MWVSLFCGVVETYPLPTGAGTVHNRTMFLKCNKRKKDGKVHRYWSIVENTRGKGGKVHQRQVFYLGEINSSQEEAWRKTIDVLQKQGEEAVGQKQLSLFPHDGAVPVDDQSVVQVRLDKLSLQNPRQFGGCWLFSELWERLHLDRFWRSRLPKSRKGTDWVNVLKIQTAYHLMGGGSEWRLHRQWYANTAMGDILGEDQGLVQKDKLYRNLDKLVEHKNDLFQHLQKRWKTLFAANFDVLLYDLTSTYFESDPPDEGMKRYGYSRDKRGDCVQVVIALIVTPEGFPLTYEVMPGNTADCKTLKLFAEKIEALYGKANRTWIMDRGIPTEDSLAAMREAGVGYLVGTPKGKLTALEAEFLKRPWQDARQDVTVKLHHAGDEFYVLVQSEKRVCKERSMRRQVLKKYWKRLKQIQAMKRISRDQMLMKIGNAKGKAGRLANLIKLHLPGKGRNFNAHDFRFEIDKDKMRKRRRHEGRYLLRSNQIGGEPEAVWEQYLLLTEIEQAFKELKHDLNIRPVYHSKDERVEAHIFVCFMAYCLQVTLKNLLKRKASGLTPQEVIQKLSEIQMVVVHLPTRDGGEIIMPRYTKPKAEHELVLKMVGIELPKQPTPYLIEREIAKHQKETVLATTGEKPIDTLIRKVYRTHPYHKWKRSGDFRGRRRATMRLRPTRPP